MGQESRNGLHSGAYRWIVVAAKLLKESRDGMGLERRFYDEVDRLLSGVPCPPEDLGFNSPADIAARSESWRPMETAPKDGTLVLLLIYPDEERCCPLEDTEKGSRTVGHNNFEHDGEDRWLFSGWSWEQDHYTQGDGNPAGWMPLPEAA